MFHHEEPNPMFRAMHDISEEEERLIDDLLAGITESTGTGITVSDLIHQINRHMICWTIEDHRRVYLSAVILGTFVGLLFKKAQLAEVVTAH